MGSKASPKRLWILGTVFKNNYLFIITLFMCPWWGSGGKVRYNLVESVLPFCLCGASGYQTGSQACKDLHLLIHSNKIPELAFLQCVEFRQIHIKIIETQDSWIQGGRPVTLETIHDRFFVGGGSGVVCVCMTFLNEHTAGYSSATAAEMLHNKACPNSVAEIANASGFWNNYTLQLG